MNLFENLLKIKTEDDFWGDMAPPDPSEVDMRSKEEIAADEEKERTTTAYRNHFYKREGQDAKPVTERSGGRWDNGPRPVQSGVTMFDKFKNIINANNPIKDIFVFTITPMKMYKNRYNINFNVNASIKDNFEDPTKIRSYNIDSSYNNIKVLSCSIDTMDETFNIDEDVTDYDLDTKLSKLAEKTSYSTSQLKELLQQGIANAKTQLEKLLNSKNFIHNLLSFPAAKSGEDYYSLECIDISLAEQFIKFHDNIDNYKAKAEAFNSVYSILDKYGDATESVDVQFAKATLDEQQHMIELLRMEEASELLTEDFDESTPMWLRKAIKQDTSFKSRSGYVNNRELPLDNMDWIEAPFPGKGKVPTDRYNVYYMSVNGNKFVYSPDLGIGTDEKIASGNGMRSISNFSMSSLAPYVTSYAYSMKTNDTGAPGGYGYYNQDPRVSNKRYSRSMARQGMIDRNTPRDGYQYNDDKSYYDKSGYLVDPEKYKKLLASQKSGTQGIKKLEKVYNILSSYRTKLQDYKVNIPDAKEISYSNDKVEKKFTVAYDFYAKAARAYKQATETLDDVAKGKDNFGTPSYKRFDGYLDEAQQYITQLEDILNPKE